MLEELNDYLEELSEAFTSIKGTLGTLRVANVYDPPEIARAVAQMELIIDAKLSHHMNNPAVAQLAAKMKAGYQLKMLDAVDAKKAEFSGHGFPGTLPLSPLNLALPSPIGPSRRPRNLTAIPGMHGCPSGTPFHGWPPARRRTRRP